VAVYRQIRKEYKDFSVRNFYFTAKTRRHEGFSNADLRRDCFGLRPRNDKQPRHYPDKSGGSDGAKYFEEAARRNPLFFIFRDIDDTDADGFVADGVEVGEACQRGGDFILSVRMSGDDDGDSAVRAGDFVLEDARNADGVVGEDLANLREDAGLVLDH
jgi:hypothetical protein